MSTAHGMVLLAALAVGLAACGERPQVVTYKAGTYQGKTDTRPWDGGEFKGDRQAWENALASRAQGQNEYKRVQ